MRNVMMLMGLLLVTGVLGVAWAKGDWSDAQNKVEALKRAQIELRKLIPAEVQRIVEATCAAKEDERRKAGEDAAERVARAVSSEYYNLKRMREDTYRAIEDVLADEALKDRHDEAKRLRKDVEERWDSLMNMTEGAMRGGNHPLIAFLSAKGIEEHRNYQRNTSNCDAYEFPTGRRKADCLVAAGETCYVIELKPNNSAAISEGKTQVREAAEDLSEDLKKGDQGTKMKELIRIDSDFAKCKRWEQKLRCYTLCPKVDEKGEFEKPDARWSDCS